MNDMFYVLENEFCLQAFREDLKRVGYTIEQERTLRRGTLADHCYSAYSEYHGALGDGIKIYTNAEKQNHVYIEIWIYKED